MENNKKRLKKQFKYTFNNVTLNNKHIKSSKEPHHITHKGSTLFRLNRTFKMVNAYNTPTYLC